MTGTQGHGSVELEELVARVRRIEWSDHDARIAALTAVTEQPGATSDDVADAWDEIHQHHRQLGRFDDAITAKRRAIAAGYRSTPDPEADIAEIYVHQGRLDDAAALYAQLRARHPDDVWLHSSAAWAYEPVDPAESLRWALTGVDTAIATGDPDRVISDLRAHATRAWTALGLPADDEVLQRIDAFTNARTSTRHSPTPNRAATPPEAPASARARSTPVGFAWFPAAEWTLATQRWPDLLDGRPADHQAYCRVFESKLKAFRQRGGGVALHVSPITVEELVAHSDEHGNDPGSGDARSQFAAEVLRTGRALPWPPARNDGCWCGSGRKYKQCCGPTRAEHLSDPSP